jgi:preprotein translocase subunit YajC
MMPIIMIGMLGFLFWIMIIKPQKRQERERDAMLSALEKGDKVVTIGGIYGTVTDIDKEGKVVTLEVAKNVKMDFTRSAVSQITKKKKQPQKETK